MLDFHDDAKASYYEYSTAGCNNVDRTKFQNVFAGGCNEEIDGAFGLTPNVRMMWKWATTRLSLADGVKGPLVEVFNGNHFCGYPKPTYRIEYPAEPQEACILNLTDTLADPLHPVPLHYRFYFTVSCMADKMSMVIKDFRDENGRSFNEGSWRQGSNLAQPGELVDFRTLQHGHPKRCLQNPTNTSYITQACKTDGRDSWRAGLFGCGFVNPSTTRL